MSLWNFFLRSPRPGYDWSVTLPTTATTNQFHKYLGGDSSSDALLFAQWAFMKAEAERLQAAVHELEETVEQEESRANENAREIHKLRMAIKEASHKLDLLLDNLHGKDYDFGVGIETLLNSVLPIPDKVGDGIYKG